MQRNCICNICCNLGFDENLIPLLKGEYSSRVFKLEACFSTETKPGPLTSLTHGYWKDLRTDASEKNSTEDTTNLHISSGKRQT